MIYIGIDNGVTGSIGIIAPTYSRFMLTPVIKEQSYTKAKQMISRINFMALLNILDHEAESDDCKVMIERPMVNPQMFKASVSAIRALESTINVLELCGMPVQYLDSKEWQKALLPQGVKGSPELKKASVDIGCRLFPEHRDLIVKHKDADGMLMAEYCRRFYSQ